MKSRPAKLRNLKGLGVQSEKHLNEIGIFSKSDLEKIGPIQAFMMLKEKDSLKPSLNFLYAMWGALLDVPWTQIAQEEKASLLMELKASQDLEKRVKK